VTRKKEAAPEAGTWVAQPFDTPAERSRLNVGDKMRIYAENAKFTGYLVVTIVDRTKTPPM
jgi:hypothetical protein